MDLCVEGLRSGILKGRCLRAVLAAELTDTSFTVREQEHAFFPGTPQQCGELKIDSRFEPQLLKATETVPSHGGPDAGMAFAPSTAFMNLPSTIGPLQRSLWPRPTAGTYIFEAQSKICTTLGTPVFQCFEPLGARFYDSARYALGLSDAQWSVDIDAPSPAILGTRDTFHFLTAWEREGQRLLSVRIPSLPAFNGTEATGARITISAFLLLSSNRCMYGLMGNASFSLKRSRRSVPLGACRALQVRISRSR